MSDKICASGGWMVEVLDDGTRSRHRRYLIAAESREEAIAAIRNHLGEDIAINSTSALSVAAFASLKLRIGEVIPLSEKRG